MKFLSDAALRAIVVGGVPWNGVIGHPSSSLSVIAEHHKSSINLTGRHLIDEEQIDGHHAMGLA